MEHIDRAEAIRGKTIRYTLTVVLNFRDQNVVGFASSAKDWRLVRGRFDVMS